MEPVTTVDYFIGIAILAGQAIAMFIIYKVVNWEYRNKGK